MVGLEDTTAERLNLGGTMTTEDLSHRSHKLNPRRHPTGKEYADNSKSKLARRLTHVALLSPSEMHFIQDVPKILGNGNYANLGHSRGGSALLLADGLREKELQGEVHSVDLFPTTERFRDAVFQLDRFDMGKWITLCSGSTDHWSSELRNKRFNFVFIDADHTYNSVVSDFNNWSVLVKPGGWMSFHDTNQEFSHNAIEDTVAKDETWVERTEFHIDRIRTFERKTK